MGDVAPEASDDSLVISSLDPLRTSGNRPIDIWPCSCHLLGPWRLGEDRMSGPGRSLDPTMGSQLARKTKPGPSSSPRDSGEIQEALRWQVRRHAEDLLKEARGHELAAARWGLIHGLVGLPAAVLAALAGISAFSENDVLAGILAGVVTVLTTVNTWAKPSEKASQHLKRSTALTEIANETIDLYNTDLVEDSFATDHVERELTRLRQEEKKERDGECPGLPERVRKQVVRIVTRREEDPLTNSLQAFAPLEVGEKVRAFQGQMDPALRLVFGDHISKLLRGVETAVTNHVVVLDEGAMLPGFYELTLRAFPGASFSATSVPSKGDFWGNQAIIEAITAFIRNGGKMRRIFFIHDSNQLKEPEVKEVLDTQRRMGVTVYLARGDKTPIPSRLHRLLLVEDQGRIGWEVEVDERGLMKRVEATSDSNTISEYQEVFNELLKQSEKHP
jgi:hypothetical protein